VTLIRQSVGYKRTIPFLCLSARLDGPSARIAGKAEGLPFEFGCRRKMARARGRKGRPRSGTEKRDFW
jgi:hypothetical protein